MENSHKAQTQTPSQHDRAPIIAWDRLVFSLFCTDFSCVAASFNKKLCKSQRESFDRLSEEDVEALETLKVKLVEAKVLILPPFHGDHKLGTEACSYKIC